MKTIITNMPNMRDFRKGIGGLEIGYPWLARGAILTLEDILTPNYKVLELGSGGSTIFFGRRVKYVKSLETDIEWYDKVLNCLTEYKLDNVDLFCRSSRDLLNIIKKEPDESYDLILSDTGPSYKTRYIFTKAAIPKLKKGGYLVIDNYGQRYLKNIDLTNYNIYTFDEMRYSGFGTKICRKI